MKSTSKALMLKAFVFLFVITQPVFADSYDDAFSAYSNEDYEAAVKIWSSSELENDPRALFSLGRLYMKGLGVVENKEVAVEFYARAAKLGHSSAQYNLGLAYFQGSGVAQDMGQAISLWAKAANMGHGAAQYNMGALMWEGKEVKKDQAIAMKWFREAKNNGNTQAAEFLASLFVPMYSKLNTKAKYYIEKKLDREPSSSEELDVFTKGRQAYNSGNFEQAYKYWITEAKDGHGESQYLIATMYERGEGVTVNIENAIKWYQEAAKLNHAEAQYRLGTYHFNEAPEVNETLGLYWMQSAADNGHPDAQSYIDSRS